MGVAVSCSRAGRASPEPHNFPLYMNPMRHSHAKLIFVEVGRGLLIGDAIARVHK